MVCQRKRRFVQKLNRANLPNLRRTGPLSLSRRESSHATLLGDQEPLVQRRQQAHCRQHSCSSHADDCRKPHRRKRRDGESGRQPDKQKQLRLTPVLWGFRQKGKKTYLSAEMQFWHTYTRLAPSFNKTGGSAMSNLSKLNLLLRSPCTIFV